MKKIRLDMDRLDVASFETARQDAAPGTVRGHWTGASNCETYCGAQCPSGPRPCEFSYAWTDGVAVCKCMDGGETGIVC